MARRKLRDIRVAIQARLGFGAVEQPAITPILNSFLYEAQYRLFLAGEWPTLTRYWDFTVALGAANVAYPIDTGVALDADTITKVAVNIGAGTAHWIPVERGISLAHYSQSTQQHHPARYELRVDGFEFWPTRDKAYTARVWGKRELPSFSQDSDEAALDDSAIFLVALADAKAHYRQPDAQKYEAQAAAIFTAMKHSAIKGILRAGPEEDPMPRPVVV